MKLPHKAATRNEVSSNEEDVDFDDICFYIKHCPSQKGFLIALHAKIRSFLPQYSVNLSNLRFVIRLRYI